MMKHRIIFFGSGDFPVPTFKSLVHEGYNVVGVVTSNDNIRSEKESMKNAADRMCVPCLIPKDLTDPRVAQWLKDLKPDLFVVISYKMLPQTLLDIPTINSFNVHASSLPYLKGAAPINWAIYHGFKETGLTAFLLNNRMDGGNIIASRVYPIYDEEYFGDVFQFLSERCTGFTIFVLKEIFGDENYYIKSIPQMNFNYKEIIDSMGINPFIAPKLNSENTKIKWGKPIISIYNQIRAFSPYPGAIGRLNVRHCYPNTNGGKTIKFERFNIKIFKAKLVLINSLHHDIKSQMTLTSSSNVVTDKKKYIYYYSMIDGDMEYALEIERLQLTGKKEMNVKDFLNGFRGFNPIKENDEVCYSFY